MNRRTFACLSGFAGVALMGWFSAQLPVLRQGVADEPQEVVKPRPAAAVAVIDIAKVFKEHSAFKKRMAELKTMFEDFQATSKARQAEIEQLATAAKTLKTGTDPFEQETRRVQRMAVELQADATAMQRKLMKEEAEIYAAIYREVGEKVSAYARANGIRLVLRFNGDPMDTSDRNSVLVGVNNSIVFQDQLDITDEIIRRVNDVPAKS